LHFALCLVAGRVQRRGVLGTQPVGLGLNGAGLLEGALRAGAACLDDPEGGIEPEHLEDEPERHEERNLNRQGQIIRRDLQHGKSSPSPTTGRAAMNPGRKLGGVYLASSECALRAAPSARSSFGKNATLRSLSARCASAPPIEH